MPGGRLTTRYRWALAAVLVGALFGAPSAWAALSSSAAAVSQSFTTKRIFPTTATVTAEDLEDASGGGAEVSSANAASLNDGVIFNAASNYPTSYSAAKYVEFQMSSPLAAGQTTSGLQLNVGMRDGAAGASKQACYYAELRRTSTSALLSTYGSSGSPLACATSNSTTLLTATSLTGVSSSDLADDLTVRLYIWTDLPARNSTVDNVTITGTATGSAFTLYPDTIVDSSGTPTTTTNPLSALDSVAVTSAASWQTTFAAARYQRLVFPGSIPSGATVTGATLSVTLKPQSAVRTLCFYVEVYNSATLIATHGSSGTPTACVTGGSYTTTNVSLPEINTDTRANNVQVRLYMSSNAAGTSSLDVATLAVSYSLT